MKKEVGVVLVCTIGVIIFNSFVLAAGKAPKIEIENEIYVCEGKALSYIFSASDIDRENLSANIFPKNFFFVSELEDNENSSLKKFEIFSGIINKNQTGKDYEERVFVSDGDYGDGKNILIKVIEINNPPEIADLGVETIDLEKGNAFNKQVYVSDIEDGTSTEGKLIFNLSFVSGKEIFGIDKEGRISFYANKSHIGNYLIRVCAKDLGIEKIDKRIRLCGKDGKSIQVCKEISLTITEKNRLPTINSHSPFPGEIIIKENESRQLEFNITAFDPDRTKVGINWYIDGILMEKNREDFSYFLECSNRSINHSVKVEVTDGLETDSLEWKIYGRNLTCVPEESSCKQREGCNEWGLCQRALQSAEIGVLSEEDYDKIKKSCGDYAWADANCGYQIRICSVFDDCDKQISQNQDIKECYFTYNPTCTDGIKNCHQSNCEELVDCGGPCGVCATCFDRLKNQVEEGIDCGGPCVEQCTTYKNFYDKKGIKYFFTIGIIAFIIVLVLIVRKILNLKKEEERIPTEKLR